MNSNGYIITTLPQIPGFGWGTWLLGNIMIKRDWTKDKKKIANSFKSMRELQAPTWLISYPEGTRMTPEKVKEVNIIQLSCRVKSLL
jgi:lysophosphatidic acid acyltransferase/lysophosphatidylinositol acyltransferase